MKPGWMIILSIAAGLTAVPVTSGGATRDEALEAEAEGRWEQALEAWAELAGGATEGPRPRMFQANHLRVLEITGQFSRLETLAREAAARFPGWDVPLIHLARALEAQGDAEGAAVALDSAEGSSLPAGAERARLLLGLGRREAAVEIMERVLKTYRAARERTPRDRLAAGHAARFREDYHGAARMYETAYRDSVGFLDARLSLAYLFQEKYQANLAAEELTQATRLAPHHPDVHLAAARLALLNNRLASAELAAKQVLEIRPRDPGALAVLARLSLIAADTDQALRHLEPVLSDRPTHLEARSLAVAAAYLAGDSTTYHRETERILDQDPGYASIFLDLGRLLEMSRRHEEAFAMYDRLLARDPDNARAYIAKGHLAMRQGNEAEARGYLEKGFAGDPFNIRAYNQLELLDKMETFTSTRTEHFEIRMEAAKDSLLLTLLEERLEPIYDELTRLHGWEPEVTTVIEIFPSHDWFSARVTGLPWVGGIPAVCFGTVVATDSPRTLAGQTNWEDVLRHEFGHVMALGMTRNKVPFWFTEGLSVFLERYPRGRRWDENLVAARVDGELVPVDSLTIAFTRPRKFSQRLLAYHESGLIIEDLVKRKGWEVIPRMLRAFGEGKSLDRTVQDVVGDSPEAFRRRALEVVQTRADQLPIWPRPDRERWARLDEESVRRFRDPEFLERWALTQYQMDPGDEGAVSTASKLLELDPDNARAHVILGLSHQHGDRADSARIHLQRAEALGSRDLPLYLALSDLAGAEQDTAGAISYLSRALEIYPLLTRARTRRARLLVARGEREQAKADYETLIRDTGAAGRSAVELARLELEAGNGSSAGRALHYAQESLPLDAEVEALRGQAYLLLDRDREAYDLFLKARRLDLRSVESMVGMASYYLKVGDYEEAAYFAELALKYRPDHPVALEVLARARAG